jgi:hypothetical protein
LACGFAALELSLTAAFFFGVFAAILLGAAILLFAAALLFGVTLLFAATLRTIGLARRVTALRTARAEALALRTVFLAALREIRRTVAVFFAFARARPLVFAAFRPEPFAAFLFAIARPSLPRQSAQRAEAGNLDSCR